MTSGLVAVLAAALVSGSRDPVTDVLAGAPAAPGGPGGTPVAAPPAVPHLPWSHARSSHAPASVSTATTSAALVSATDIPQPALVAYQRAATVIDTADPTCHLDWTLLAAIGRIESDHGRFGGSSLDAQGVDHPAVLGPPLDGQHGTSLVRDTDAGRLDHDRRYDRAVGPMQFLPSTWAVVAVDGDGDGRRNVQDINDAALGAAVYVCAGNDDLATGAGQRRAVFGYNHSHAYVADVLAVARAYRAGSPFVGITTTPTGTLLSARAGNPTVVVAHGPPADRPDHATPASTSSLVPWPQPNDRPTPTPTPTLSPSDTPTPTPTSSSTPTATPVEPTTGPTSDPTPDPTPGPTDGPSTTPTGDPSTTPTGDPSASPTGDPTATPTEPPVIPDPLPTALAVLTPAQVTAIDEAWPVCRDRLPTTWTRRELRRCLAHETGMPHHDAGLVAFVRWWARHEPDAAS